MEQRETWKSVRLRLLDLHKILLDRERTIYETTHAPIESPGAFLQLVLADEQFAWLRKLSGLIVQFDEALSLRKPATPEQGAALMVEVRQLLTADDSSTFTHNYRQALAETPQAAELNSSLLGSV